MKLDPDLLRAILLKVEDGPREYPGEVEIAGTDRVVVSYHVEKLNEAGYLRGSETWDNNDPDRGPIYVDNQLTFSGHEFLGNIRDVEVWRSTKALAKKSGIGTVAALVNIAVAVASDAISRTLRGE